MSDLRTVRQLWRELDVDAGARDPAVLVGYASLAASSHNTQPWRFRVEPGRIVILPDLTRRCPYVDPDDHHLYASLGCAAENLTWAALASGFATESTFDPATSELSVRLESTAPERTPLFDAIAVRQCSRTTYDGSRLSRGERDLLERAGAGDGVSVRWFTEPVDIDRIGEYVTAGNAIQFRDPQWLGEMKAWIRFNNRDGVRTGDGLYGPALGIPRLPGWLGRAMMQVATSPERQSRKDLAHLRSSAAVAVIYTERDDPRHWIEAGRCYERLALQAAALGLRSALMNQPVEVPELRAEFAAFLGIDGGRPDLVVRFGRGPLMPSSRRRPVEEVLIGAPA